MASFISDTFDPTEDINLQIEVLCAPAFAAYKHRLDDVIDLDPERLALGEGTALNDLDEAVIALVNRAAYAAFREGVRSVFTWAGGEASAASEWLCRTCHGHGRLREPGQPARLCEVCEGTGTVEAVAA